MNKLIIAGSRTFNDYELLEYEVKRFIVTEQITCPTIISGTAMGADEMGEIFAANYNLPLELYPADWKQYGKSAGMIRNEQMAKIATHCIVFWNGESSGTKNMIDFAKKYNLKLKIHLF